MLLAPSSIRAESTSKLVSVTVSVTVSVPLILTSFSTISEPPIVALLFTTRSVVTIRVNALTSLINSSIHSLTSHIV